MKMLGRYNWYLPKWLEWIPNVSLGEQPVETHVHPAPEIKRTPAKTSPGKAPVAIEEED